MVFKLTLNKISFFSPFLLKSFGLFIFTNRAISLFSILFVKLMSVLAEYFVSVYRAYRKRIFESILLLSNTSKMLWINTFSISTEMIYDHTIWYTSIRKIIGHPMSTSILFHKKEFAISVSINIFRPYKTFANNLIIRLKSLFIYFHIGDYTPLITILQ